MSEPESHREGGSSMGDLRARIEQLQRSVEELTSEGDWSAPPEPEPVAPAPVQPPPPTQPEQPATASAPPEVSAAPTVPPPAIPPPIADAPAAAAVRAETWAEPSAPSPPPIEPAAPPANGHVPAPVDAPLGTVVEAGPLADLIELHRFEDELSALEGVAEVRVRRFGHGRATIEVAMRGEHELAPQLRRLNRPMQLARGAGGELVIGLGEQPDAPLNGDGPGGPR